MAQKVKLSDKYYLFKYILIIPIEPIIILMSLKKKRKV